MSYFVKTISTSSRTQTTKCHNLATANALVRGLQNQGGLRLVQLLDSNGVKLVNVRRPAYGKAFISA